MELSRFTGCQPDRCMLSGVSWKPFPFPRYNSNIAKGYFSIGILHKNNLFINNFLYTLHKRITICLLIWKLIPKTLPYYTNAYSGYNMVTIWLQFIPLYIVYILYIIILYIVYYIYTIYCIYIYYTI